MSSCWNINKILMGCKWIRIEGTVFVSFGILFDLWIGSSIFYILVLDISRSGLGNIQFTLFRWLQMFLDHLFLMQTSRLTHIIPLIFFYTPWKVFCFQEAETSGMKWVKCRWFYQNLWSIQQITPRWKK